MEKEQDTDPADEMFAELALTKAQVAERLLAYFGETIHGGLPEMPNTWEELVKDMKLWVEFYDR